MRTDEAEHVVLGDVCHVQLGKMLSPKSKTGKRPIPYLRNENVQWDRFDLSDVSWMDYSEAEEAKFHLVSGDLLVCEGGEPGRAAVWEGQIDRCCYQKALHRIRPRNGRISPRYLMYRLWLSALKGEFAASQTKTTIAHLPREKLLQLSVRLPSLATQDQIASHLRRNLAEVAIARLAAEERVAAAEALPAAYLREVFEGNASRIWPKALIRDVGQVNGGIQKSPNRAPRAHHHPYLTVRNVQRGSLDLSHVERFEVTEPELERLRLRKGDILVVEGTNESIDHTHVFPLSQIYEGLLLKMGEKGSDAGQFFTPREVIRAMVRAIDPKIGETVYDPCCGTGGFLAQAAEYMQPKPGKRVSAAAIAQLRQETFWAREKENLIYPIGLANLILHGIDRPNIWHGNALTGDETYGGLFAGAPTQFDVILTNPPFGGKESAAAQTGFDYPTSATQVLFLQHVIRALKTGGRCGMVIDEGVLFRTNEDAFVKTKRKLTDECNLWCILSLPGGVFSAAGAGVKTNLLFFTKGKPTETIWYYDLSDVKVGKKTPLTLKHFEDFAAKLATREDSERSWTVDLSGRRAKAADEARPMRDTARDKSREADQVKDQLSALKKAKPRDDASIDAAEARIAALLKVAREATNRADDIENAVYDLKAVNPNRKVDADRRTPTELLDLIELKGREIAGVLQRLRALSTSEK